MSNEISRTSLKNRNAASEEALFAKTFLFMSCFIEVPSAQRGFLFYHLILIL